MHVCVGVCVSACILCLQINTHTHTNRYNLLAVLDEMINSKAWQSKQGALMTYERLFVELGSCFEPYLVKILPSLLACFGDSIDVRMCVWGGGGGTINLIVLCMCLYLHMSSHAGHPRCHSSRVQGNYA
jgi:hypothetical protein